MTTRARVMNPIFDHLPCIVNRPAALTSGTAVTGKAIDLQPISGQGLGLMAQIACTMGAGPNAADTILAEAKVTHCDTEGGSYVDYKVLDAQTVNVGSAAGAHTNLVVWPRINLKGAKRYVKVVFEVTANAGNTGAVSAIVGSVVGLLGGKRDECQDDAYDQDGYVTTDSIEP